MSMRTVALSGWGQPHDALSIVVPDAHHVDYVHLDSEEAALAKIGKAAQGKDFAIGWSLGGQLLVKATAAGVIEPKRLILIGVPFQFVETNDIKLGMPRHTYELFCENYKNNPERTLKKGWDLIAYQDEREHKVKTELEKHDAQKVLSRDWGKWLEMLTHSTCDHLSFADFPPTLIIHGDRDAVVWPEQARQFEKRLGRKSRLALWEGCGHAPHWHDPQALKNLIRDFTQNV